MAKRGHIFTLGELLKLRNPIDTRNLSVADVMMFMGHKFSVEEEKQLEIDHINFEYSAYAGFFLLDYFKACPKNPLLCPMCQHELVGSSIKLSDAAYDGIGDKEFSIHDYSSLFVCSFCKWWYVRESWYEYERGFAEELINRYCQDIRAFSTT